MQNSIYCLLFMSLFAFSMGYRCIIEGKQTIVYLLWVLVGMLLAFLVLVFYGASFVGSLYIIVYLGAIMIVFLFAILLVRAKVREVSPVSSMFVDFFIMYYLGVFIGVCCCSFESSEFLEYVDWVVFLGNYDYKILGFVLYVYAVPVVFALALLLLVAIVVSIFLVVHANKEAKMQDIVKQLSVDSMQRIIIKD